MVCEWVANHIDTGTTSARAGGGGDEQHINATEHWAYPRVGVRRILPGLRDAAVVPVQRAVVVPGLPVLDVLDDRVVWRLLAHLHLLRGVPNVGSRRARSEEPDGSGC